MLDHYKEIRKQDALERLRNRQVENILEIHKKAAKQTIKTKEKVKVEFIEKDKQEFKKTANCVICTKEYQTYIKNPRQTCGEAKCVSMLKSQKQKARNLDRANPRECLHPNCNNILNPDKKRYRQKLYCSVSCARQHSLIKKSQKMFL